MSKNKKLVHFAPSFSSKHKHLNGAVCGGEGLPCCTTAMSYYREEVTCKKCKKTPQFLIHNYERRFG